MRVAWPLFRRSIKRKTSVMVQMGKDSLHFDRACYNFERIFVYHPLTHLTYIVAVCAERRSELHLPRAWLFTAFVGARNPTHSGSGPVSRPSDSVRGRWGPTPLGAVSSARLLQPPLVYQGAHSPSAHTPRTPALAHVLHILTAMRLVCCRRLPPSLSPPSRPSPSQCSPPPPPAAAPFNLLSEFLP